MSLSDNKRVNHLVVDSSAFIRQAPLNVSLILIEILLNERFLEFN
jgi:hypothetical protein